MLNPAGEVAGWTVGVAATVDWIGPHPATRLRACECSCPGWGQAVVEQMHGEIDIGPFLLGLGDLRRSLFPHRVNERHSNLVAQKVPKVHLDLGPVGSQGAEVEILALRLRPVGRRGRHSRREILDRQDLVMGLKDPREQCRQVQPFPGRALERSIVEVEAVDVDDGAHASPSEKARASEEALRPAVETTGGVLNNIAAAGSEFNKPRPRPVASDSPPSPHPLPGGERRCFDGSPSHGARRRTPTPRGDRRSPGLVGVPTESRIEFVHGPGRAL